MKKVGIVGGLGPASTVEYYKNIISRVMDTLKENVYPEISIESIDLEAFLKDMREEKYDSAADKIACAVNHLENSGADFIAIASNTPHIILDRVLKRSNHPILSIVDSSAEYIKRKNYKRVLIVGTKFTMKSGLYKNALEKYGVETFIPDDDDIEKIYNIITPNLENGIIIKEDREKMIEISEKYISKYSADSILLGCTEIPLIIKQGDMSVPVIDTTDVHIDDIVCNILK